MSSLRTRLDQAAGIVQVLRKRGGFRAFRTWRPFSITAFEMTRRLREAGYRFATIVDGGANAGQFARACAETWPEARIYAFEPLPAVAALLRHNLHDLEARVQIHEVALGPSAASVKLHHTPYSLQSSVLKPAELPYEAVEVKQARLDDLLHEAPLASPLLLKLDLQGYELEALRGAPELLARTDAVLLEIGFEASYEGEPTFEVLWRFLDERGFCLDRPVDVLWEQNQIVQMDALFIRARRTE